jgi:hypothetical protein
MEPPTSVSAAGGVATTPQERPISRRWLGVGLGRERAVPGRPVARVRIDPATGSSKPIRVPFAAAAVTIGGNAVWALGTDGEVARIDRTGRVTAVIQATGRGATRVASGFDAVWALNPMLGTLTRIDPAADEVVAIIDIGEGANRAGSGRGLSLGPAPSRLTHTLRITKKSRRI